ncbi:MAG TPA: hypothetical protein VG389_23965 [Myxococcota bacterium]|jgi:hypothetical protein|nr:hypothetical protein [Myxococcota bacterium]
MKARLHRFAALAVAALAFAACRPITNTGSDAANPGTDAGPPPAPEIGTGDHTAASVGFTVVADATAGLDEPRDIGFNPVRPDEAWVVNYNDDSVTIIHDTTLATRTTEWRKDGYALHFMDQVSAIAFGADATSTAPIPTGVGGLPGTFATTGESRNDYDGMAAPNDFYGATLWSSDLTVFAMYNPIGLGSHLDMLHCSPLGMGIAHESANIYWVFSGLSNSITKYNFNADNGVGNDNHSDGEAYRYVEGQVSYFPGVPSHMVFDPTDSMLYIADTGNSRIAKLDTLTGTLGSNLQPFEPMAAYRRVDGALMTDVVGAATGALQRPSGLEMYNGLLYVTDNANGRFFAFTLDGTLMNYLDTGLGADHLAGFAFGPDDKIYFVDMVNDQVIRLDP